jgi:hypothetical protein
LVVPTITQGTLYVFSHESRSESNFFRPADGCRRSPGRGAHLDPHLAGGNAENFGED